MIHYENNSKLMCSCTQENHFCVTNTKCKHIASILKGNSLNAHKLIVKIKLMVMTLYVNNTSTHDAIQWLQ